MVAGLTEQNLKVLERALTARTTSTAAQTINLTWSNLQLFSGFALCRLAGFSNNATLVSIHTSPERLVKYTASIINIG